MAAIACRASPIILQSQLGVGLNGIVMVSPYLDPGAIGSDDNALSPLPWMITCRRWPPANLERQGKLDRPGGDGRGRGL